MTATASDQPVVIVNRRAGAGVSEARWARLAAAITDGLGPFEPRFTERPGHATELARAAAAEGRALVVALGGDGTINEVANGLVGTDSALGIIPRGTGGDFRRTLDLPTDVAQAARRVREGSVRRIDLGRVHLTGHDGAPVTRHYVNVGSLGFSAAVADRANRSWKGLGAKLSFMGATLRTLIGQDNVELTLALDGAEPVRRRVVMVAFGNGRYFGGGMKICPHARLDSGSLDLVVVGDMSRLEVALKSNRLYDGTHLALEAVSHATVRRAEVAPVDPDARVLVELDGEIPGRLPAAFEVVPATLTLRA